jgi:ketosteroid isomerase-like protein
MSMKANEKQAETNLSSAMTGSMNDPIIQLVLQFNAALNAGDVDAMMRLMTRNCVFENTDPPPDGMRYVGQDAVRAFWETFFRASREPNIQVEEIFAMGERCVMRWTYRWSTCRGTRAPGEWISTP